MTLLHLRYPPLPHWEETAFYLRNAGFGRKRILRGLQERFPRADPKLLEAAAREAAAVTVEQAGYRYMCSTFTESEWKRYEGGEPIERIYIGRLDRREP